MGQLEGGHWVCRTLKSCLVLAPPHPLLRPPQEIRMLKKVVSVHPVSARFGAGDRGGGRAGRMGRAEAVEGLPEPGRRLPGAAQGALGGAMARGHSGSQASFGLIS